MLGIIILLCVPKTTKERHFLCQSAQRDQNATELLLFFPPNMNGSKEKASYFMLVLLFGRVEI